MVGDTDISGVEDNDGVLCRDIDIEDRIINRAIYGIILGFGMGTTVRMDVQI